MTGIDLTPDPEEIVQAEGPDVVPPILVEHAGPVGTRELPGIRGNYRTESGITNVVGVRLLALEPRRKSATLTAVDQDIWIAASQAAAQVGGSSAYYVPKGVRFHVDHMGEVWAIAATATTAVSVATTPWSE